MSLCTDICTQGCKGNFSSFLFSLAACLYVTFFLQIFPSLPCLIPTSGHSASLKYLFQVSSPLWIILQTLLSDFFFLHQTDTVSKSWCSINTGTLQPVCLQPGILCSRTFQFYSLILT